MVMKKNQIWEQNQSDGALRGRNFEAVPNQEDGDADAEGQRVPCGRLRDQHVQTPVQIQVRRTHEA